MTSIVRRGNHFIRLEDEWCLIDGPWFSYLELMSNGSSMPVRLYGYDIPSEWLVWDGAMPPAMQTDYIEWEPRKWYPEHIRRWEHKPWITWTELHLIDRWNKWMKSRIRTGYVFLPDGELPEFLNRRAPKDADNGWWLDAWEWYR